MNFIKRLIYDFRVTKAVYLLFGGLTALLLAVLTLISSACHPCYRFLLLPRHALPFWIFALISILLFILMACGAGALLCCQQYCKLIFAPLVCYALSLSLCMLWFHLLFRSFHILLAIIILLTIIFMQILIIKSCVHLHSLSVIASILSILILLHMLWLNIGIAFLN